jgi:hypothetical protein
MLLSVSLVPWQKRSIEIIAVFIAFASISCFARPIFSPVPSTPYDHQMSRVQPALLSSSKSAPATISLDAVNAWMTQLRAMPYQYSHYWQTPSEVSLTQASDCKGKAMALYAEMRRSGAKCVRVVIGKRHIFASNTHTWLEWNTNAGTYMLDPTFNDRVVRAEELDPMTYIPFYAYDADHKYRATKPGFGTASTMVAAGPTNRIYQRTGATYVQSRLSGVGATQLPHSMGYHAPITSERRLLVATRSPSTTRNSAGIRTQQIVMRTQPLRQHAANFVQSTTRAGSAAPWQTVTPRTTTRLVQNRLTTQSKTGAATQPIVRSKSTQGMTGKHVRHVAHRRGHSVRSNRLAART